MRHILSRFQTSTLMGLAFTVPAMLIAGLLLFYHSMGARRFMADEGVRYGDMLADQLLSASQRFLRLGSLSAVQEMIEETGLKVQVGRLIGRVQRPGLNGAVIDIRDYAATVTGGTLRAGDDAADARWVAPGELESLNITEGLIDALTDWGVLGRGQ